MESDAQIAPVSKTTLWIGRVLTALPVLMMIFGAIMSFMKPPEIMKNFTHLGYPEKLAVPLGIVELLCAVIYAIPRTSVLGAILITGYLGGAVATHVRIGEPFFLPIIFGALVWGGLFLRDRRVRALIPVRT